MSDLWDKESLRGLYHFTKSNQFDELTKEAKSQGLGFFKRAEYVVPRAKAAQLKQKDILMKFDNFDSFICPHCLKTIITEEIELTCPFCTKFYSNPHRSQVGQTLEAAKKEKPIEMAFLGSAAEGLLKAYSTIIAPVIFNKCNCNSPIQYIDCYHCKNPINLFSKYDYDELMRKRYGR